MRRVAVAIVGLVWALTACGGNDDDTGSVVRPEGEADLVGAYDVAYTICEGIAAGNITPDPAIRADGDTDPEGYATEWAATYDPPFRDVYHDGCMDGFEGRPKDPPS